MSRSSNEFDHGLSMDLSQLDDSDFNWIRVLIGQYQVQAVDSHTLFRRQYSQDMLTQWPVPD